MDKRKGKNEENKEKYKRISKTYVNFSTHFQSGVFRSSTTRMLNMFLVSTTRTTFPVFLI